MTEFEKWRERDSRGAGIWTTAAYKKGWKAALKWLRDNRELNAWDDVDDMIAKELKEK